MLRRALLTSLVLRGRIVSVAPPLWAHVGPWTGAACPPGLVAMALRASLPLRRVCDFDGVSEGTLTPWDPPKRLVTIGLYKFTRNPMDVAVLCVMLGWACSL